MGVQIARFDPRVGPIINTAEAVIKKTQSADSTSLGRDIGRSIYGDAAYQSTGKIDPGIFGTRTSNRSSNPSFNFALDELINAATRSGLSEMKDQLSDELYALAASLVASNFTAPTLRLIVEKAQEILGTMSPQDKHVYQQIGEQLRSRT